MQPITNQAALDQADPAALAVIILILVGMAIYHIWQWHKESHNG